MGLASLITCQDVHRTYCPHARHCQQRERQDASHGESATALPGEPGETRSLWLLPLPDFSRTRVVGELWCANDTVFVDVDGDELTTQPHDLTGAAAAGCLPRSGTVETMVCSLPKVPIRPNADNGFPKDTSPKVEERLHPTCSFFVISLICVHSSAISQLANNCPMHHCFRKFVHDMAT